MMTNKFKPKLISRKENDRLLRKRLDEYSKVNLKQALQDDAEALNRLYSTGAYTGTPDHSPYTSVPAISTSDDEPK